MSATISPAFARALAAVLQAEIAIAQAQIAARRADIAMLGVAIEELQEFETEEAMTQALAQFRASTDAAVRAAAEGRDPLAEIPGAAQAAQAADENGWNGL